jgi:hypothetical protein
LIKTVVQVNEETELAADERGFTRIQTKTESNAFHPAYSLSALIRAISGK